MAVNHAINLTHDGTLILRIPKGYNVDKVVVEEMGTDDRKKFVHMPANISDYCDELWKKAYERGKAEIIRCKDCKWWDKQEMSLQGRCSLLQMYPTGEWYCGNAKLRRNSDGGSN